MAHNIENPVFRQRLRARVEADLSRDLMLVFWVLYYVASISVAMSEPGVVTYALALSSIPLLIVVLGRHQRRNETDTAVFGGVTYEMSKAVFKDSNKFYKSYAHMYTHPVGM